MKLSAAAAFLASVSMAAAAMDTMDGFPVRDHAGVGFGDCWISTLSLTHLKLVSVHLRYFFSNTLL